MNATTEVPEPPRRTAGGQPDKVEGSNAHKIRERSAKVERHSIDFIPLSARHGKVWHQAPFWFSGAFILPTLTIGFIGPSVGLGVGWNLVAVVVGNVVGALFMALHANQGPRLGIPQMIQSRAQFGIRGVALPLAIAFTIYIGYTAFQLIMAKGAIATMANVGSWVYIPLIVISTTLAIVGYDLLHVVQRYVAIVLLAVFTVLTVAVIVELLNGNAHQQGSQEFLWSGFLIQFGASAGYQVSYGIYVSDYSRYLKPDVSARGVIWATYIGATAGGAWMSALGTLLFAYVGSIDPVAAISDAGNGIIPGLGTAILIASILALVTVNAINSYGAMLTGTTLLDSFKRVEATLRTRVIGLVAVSSLSVIVAYGLRGNLVDGFGAFLALMTACLVPWTAINLTDFYFIRHGNYAVEEFYDAGLTPMWSMQGLLAYGVGFIAMVPFLWLSFYQGPIAEKLGGADISFFIGLIVAASVYLVLAKWRLASSRIPRLSAHA